jgi:ClpP class serine protease
MVQKELDEVEQDFWQSVMEPTKLDADAIYIKKLFDKSPL